MAKTWTTPPAVSLRADDAVDLAAIDPSSTPGFAGDKQYAAQSLESGRDTLGDLQERFFASSRHGGDKGSVLLVLQGMDTAGKGGIVRHVVGAVDPQGVAHHAFKTPTEEELAHDFLWRVRRELPGPGMIGVFDRSHYEDVLIGKVRRLASPEEVEGRYDDIVEFERELAEAGTTVVKVMLHISSDEQKSRLRERLDRPEKNWKYNPGDLDERLLWDDYQEAYQTAIRRTSTDSAPWYVVPADRKWYARVAVQRLLIDALAARRPEWPSAEFDVELEKTRLSST
ncbi:PPK2 family polyphosphate kinase [Frigoribacterium sp. CFBP9030]|uniref:PPK2 family polyphosphate kinase n=1 Tax=Frigoribacterium sp. CFBP9030 TaxID=3096537 RepID=UPI002A6B3A89|nr:PPK2 family polyphosphate kinase [Frigoribacterium sp. CFBP9030]MDY0892078.1 PPK2 family polyphosphate kinase [Frigoribacterium sp. CFBP9030]